MANSVGSSQVGGGALSACHDGGKEPATWVARAGRCGGAAPAQGRAEGPTAQLKWSVVSGQWSVVSNFCGWRSVVSGLRRRVGK